MQIKFSNTAVVIVKRLFALKIELLMVWNIGGSF